MLVRYVYLPNILYLIIYLLKHFIRLLLDDLFTFSIILCSKLQIYMIHRINPFIHSNYIYLSIYLFMFVCFSLRTFQYK